MFGALGLGLGVYGVWGFGFRAWGLRCLGPWV